MILILKRIPRSTKKYDIVEFLAPVLKGRVFQRSGSIEQIRILALQSPHANAIELHALVSIDSDVVAGRVIRKLNRKVLNGKNIGIAEYVSRSWQNDPRVNTDEPDSKVVLKRKRSRRYASLQEVSELSELDLVSDDLIISEF